MKVASKKAKGRNLQKAVRDMLLEAFPEFTDEDIRSTGMGQSGEDLQFSPAARKKIPFSWEMKNQEALNVWSALEQAEKNCKGHKPILAFKRNRTGIYVTLKIQDFIELIKNQPL